MNVTSLFSPKVIRRTLLVLSAGFFATLAPAQTLLSHYTLDGTGADAGTLARNGTLAGAATYTPTGTGVGNFSQALSVGPAATDYLTAPTSANNTAYGFSAMTITLWVNVASAANTDRLVSNLPSTNGSGFDFYIGGYTAGTGGNPDTFKTVFGFNSSSGAVSSTASYSTGQWVFLAVTYNSANTTVSFYGGGVNTTAALGGTQTKSGSIVASSADLRIGSTPATSNDRTPNALFNDVRIYSGALDLAQIEAVRASAIPEPSSFAALAGLAAAGFMVGCRRRR